jgi:hypothetical protein
MLHITGSKIKVAGDDEAVGVRFVNQSAQERVKVAENPGISPLK